MPAVDFPTIQITAQLPGASPETMAASVAAPIERQLSTIAGISSMNSSSRSATTQITIQFDLDRNIDGAALDVQTALATAARRLPVEMTTPPFFRKVNPGDFPVLYVSLRSDTMPLSTVDDYAENGAGAADLAVAGRRAGAGLWRAEIRRARAGQSGGSGGAQYFARRHPQRRRQGQFHHAGRHADRPERRASRCWPPAPCEHAADYRDVVVAYRNGAPVKLNQIAHVIDSVENDQIATWFNDARAIVLAIQRQPDANTVAVVDLVRDKLPAMRAQVPPAIQMQPLFDRSISIRDSVADVQETLAIAITLVIMVIFLFLRKVSATIIPALAVPVSLIGTCAAMYAFGFSINNMTLLALTLSVGFVVDDAIVMLENIVRHIEGGMRPFEAALKGSREIGFTIVSITFSLIAVFIPVLLMGGMVGRVFREFAVSISMAILLSGFVSLTLTPMLCARVLNSHHGEREAEFRAAHLRARLRAHAQGLRVDARPGAARTSRSCSSSRLRRLPARSGSTSSFPRASFPTEDTGYVLGITEGSDRHLVPGDGRAASARSPTSCAPIRRSTTSIRPSAPAAPIRCRNSGRMLVALKPRERTRQARAP